MRTLVNAFIMAVGIGSLALISVGARTPSQPRPSQSEPSPSLAEAIIGDWNGYLIDADHRVGFRKTEVSFRFNRSGIVSVHRYPYAPLRPIDDVFDADYQFVVNHDLLMSVHHGTSDLLIVLADLTMTTRTDDHGERDHLEFIIPKVSSLCCYLFEGGYVLDRVRP